MDHPCTLTVIVIHEDVVLLAVDCLCLGFAFRWRRGLPRIFVKYFGFLADLEFHPSRSGVGFVLCLVV